MKQNHLLESIISSTIFIITSTFCPVLAAEPSPKEDKPCADPGPIPVPAQKFKFKIKPELVGKHPRLFFDAAGLEALRQKVKDPQIAPIKDEFLRYLNQDDNRRFSEFDMRDVPPENPKNEEEPFRSFGNILPRLALAYLLTHEEKYLVATKTWIKAIISYPSWAKDRDLGAGHICFGMAVAYDWLYDEFTPEERKNIEASLLMHGRVLLQRSISKPGTWWGYSYFQNHCWINHTGIAAVAGALYEKDPAEFQSWLDYTRAQFQPTHEEMGPDGGYHEGPMYASYGITWMLFYMDFLRSLTGENLYPESKLLKGSGEFFVHNFMPDSKSYVNFGDCPVSGWISEEVYLKLASEYKDGRLLSMIEKSNKQFPKCGYKSPFCVLWADPSVTPQPLDKVPLIGIYPDSGVVVARTGWDENAAGIAFRCATPGGMEVTKNRGDQPANGFGHAHPDANSFLFWADKQWRIGAPGGYTIEKLTRNENTWLASGKGQRGEATWFDASTYLGNPNQPHIVSVATSPHADSIVGEAAPAYAKEAALSTFRRHIVFVKTPKPYVVIYDKLKSDFPQTWESYLHAFGSFRQDGENAFVSEGAGAAFGSVMGSGKIQFKTQPLEVLIFEHSATKKREEKRVQRGYELVTQFPDSSSTAWLVTVIGIEKQQVKVSSDNSKGLLSWFTSKEEGANEFPLPKVTVNQDEITWDKKGNAIFNGKPIDKYLYQHKE